DEEDCMFDQWGGGIRLLCERGFLNYTASEEKRFCQSPPFTPIPRVEADLELARRYFTYFGPASLHDAMYFFRVTASQVKKWLAVLPVSASEFDGRTYYWIEHETDFPDFPEVCFLAGFDQFLLGYEKKESLCLAPEHLRGIFNLAGIVMPSVFCRGRIIGRWKQRNKRIIVETFTEIAAEEERLLRNTAETLWPELATLSFSRL
ncbi:MAG: winged helix DNA-binding domain-containing protein, partial [Clostridia bacterium]|nr:winged helix DNA-binding domain-containing protein [Clostridia bacterium]